MTLPSPTDAEVAEFKAIYDQKYGTDLTPEEAREAATILLQLFYLGTYGILRAGPGPEGDAPQPATGVRKGRASHHVRPRAGK